MRTTHEIAGSQILTDTVRSTRTGAMFNGFPYPTKISPDAIAESIIEHTRPGDLVLDGFGGVGSTALASILSETAPQGVSHAEALRYGPRETVVYELGVLGSFVSSVLANPPDPARFVDAAQTVLEDVRKQSGWMYECVGPDGQGGELRYSIWSEVVKCPQCGHQSTVWDGCVTISPPSIGSEYRCPSCGASSLLRKTIPALSRNKDPLTHVYTTRRSRELVQVYGVSGSSLWARATTPQDGNLARRIARTPIPSAVPVVEVPFGDLYRSGYHSGITHVHQFYTRRNVIVMGQLWEATSHFDPKLRDALRYWLLGYNATHSTLMPRLVVKKGAKAFAISGAQSGVLYIPRIALEQNVLRGLERRVTPVAAALGATYGHKTVIKIVQGDCRKTHLKTGSVAYIFTDPPFGADIPYSEVNSINEAWLGKMTNPKNEIVVSKALGKTVATYGKMMFEAFTEFGRVLDATGTLTIVFHSSDRSVWKAVQSAFVRAGFRVSKIGVLNKTQGTLKQVTTGGSVRGDLMVDLIRGEAPEPRSLSADENRALIDEIVSRARATGETVELTPQRLHSRYVAECLLRGYVVALDARGLYAILRQRHGVQVD